jgi:hypothetical protein
LTIKRTSDAAASQAPLHTDQALFSTFEVERLSSPALFGDFVVLRDPYRHYIALNAYSIAAQQYFTDRNSRHQYKFVGNGARYMDTLSLHSTHERQI